MPAGPDAPDPAEIARLEAELAAELGLKGDGTTGAGDAGVDAPPAAAASKKGFAGIGRILLLPNLSVVFTSGLWWFSDVPVVRFPAHEPHHTRGGFRFQIQELELALGASIDPYARGDIFIAATLDGFELEEAYLTTLSLPASFQVRAGWFLAAFGRFNTRHFLEVSPFVDMPLVNRRFFGGEQLRGLGLEVSWLAPLPWYLELKLDLTTANNDLSFGLPIDETSAPRDFLTVGHLKQFFAISERWSLTWGLSAAQGPNASGGADGTAANRTRLFGTDVQLRWRDLESVRSVSLEAEYILRHVTVPGATVLEAGLYAHIEARVHRNVAVAARFDYHGLPSRLEGTLDFEGELLEYVIPTEEWRLGTSVSAFLSEFHRWRIQYNVHRLVGGPGGLVEAREPVHELFFQYQFILGSHGAHAF